MLAFWVAVSTGYAMYLGEILIGARRKAVGNMDDVITSSYYPGVHVLCTEPFLIP